MYYRAEQKGAEKDAEDRDRQANGRVYCLIIEDDERASSWIQIYLERSGLIEKDGAPVLKQPGREDKMNGLDAGADDYMVKPYDPDELVRWVRAVLRRSRRTVRSF